MARLTVSCVTQAGVPEVVSFMTDYGLSREDVMDTMPLLQVGRPCLHALTFSARACMLS